jgi:hypothetical protein
MKKPARGGRDQTSARGSVYIGRMHSVGVQEETTIKRSGLLGRHIFEGDE